MESKEKVPRVSGRIPLLLVCGDCATAGGDNGTSFNPESNRNTPPSPAAPPPTSCAPSSLSLACDVLEALEGEVSASVDFRRDLTRRRSFIVAVFWWFEVLFYWWGVVLQLDVLMFQLCWNESR